MEKGSKQLLKELILALAAPCQRELAILQTVPGISSVFTAIGIISEIGTNMGLFLQRSTYAHELALHQATTKVQRRKSARISKAGCYIKPLLVQCANAIVI